MWVSASSHVMVYMWQAEIRHYQPVQSCDDHVMCSLSMNIRYLAHNGISIGISDKYAQFYPTIVGMVGAAGLISTDTRILVNVCVCVYMCVRVCVLCVVCV